jgi:BMFP domain-containing protein YqiC
MSSSEPVDTVDEPLLLASERLDLVKELDNISLEQALLDVDIATARVIDLTSRLLSARADLIKAHDESAVLRARVEQLEAELGAVQSSRSYSLARKFARVRNVFK